MKSVLNIHRVGMILALAAAVGLPTGLAIACASHGPVNSGLEAAHPRSLEVAFAVRDAVTDGVLDRDAVAAQSAAKQACASNVVRVNTLRRRLTAAAPSEAGVVTLLLVDSKISAKLTPGDYGYSLTLYTSAAGGGTVVVTHGAVLEYLLNGRLSLGAALERRLVVLDGPADRTEVDGQVLAHAFSMADSPPSRARRSGAGAESSSASSKAGAEGDSTGEQKP